MAPHHGTCNQSHRTIDHVVPAVVAVACARDAEDHRQRTMNAGLGLAAFKRAVRLPKALLKFVGS